MNDEPAYPVQTLPCGAMFHAAYEVSKQNSIRRYHPLQASQASQVNISFSKLGATERLVTVRSGQPDSDGCNTTGPDC